MIRTKKILIAFVLVFMTLLAPMSALAGTRTTGGYTITFPDDMVSCRPEFNFTLSGATPEATVTFTVFVVNELGIISPLGGGDMLYNPASGVFEGSFTTMNEGINTYAARFSISDPSAGVTFKTVATYKWKVTCRVQPPPEGGQGCTPGYWKQPQHLDSWVPTDYTPSDLYDDVFGVSFDSDLTLLEALDLNGGGANALARHSTAAILNASHPDVSYAMTVDQIIAAVQAAFTSGSYETVKDLLDYYNNAGCPLN